MKDLLYISMNWHFIRGKNENLWNVKKKNTHARKKATSDKLKSWKTFLECWNNEWKRNAKHNSSDYWILFPICFLPSSSSYFLIFSSISTHAFTNTDSNTNKKQTNDLGIKGCYMLQWRNETSALTELNSQIILCGLALLLLPLFFISAIFKVRLNLFPTLHIISTSVGIYYLQNE